MRALWLCGLLSLAACGGGEEIDLTIHVDDSVVGEKVTAIKSLEIAVLGAEPSDVRYTISGQLRDRETTWIYKSKVKLPIQFVITARGDGRALIAAGRSKLLTPGGSVVTDTVHLGIDPPPPDKRRLGSACTVGVDTCASGFCVDGVCCDTACDGGCNTCKGLVPGTCSLAAAGTNPRKTCTSDAAAPCGQDGTCDGAGSCRIAPAGKLCLSPTCSAGTATSAALCDGLGNCGTPLTRDCTPYACNSMNTGCATICTAASGCAPSVSCTVGSCGKVTQGGRCFGGSDCQGGLPCIDGYCCATTCAGTCQSCKEPGHEGTCSSTALGSDDPHKVCKDGMAANCGQNGKCDGMGGCQNYPAGTLCAKGGCSTDKGSFTPPSLCAGDGSACPAPATASCAPYLCATDGSPGCGQSCGECTFYEPGMAPPFADQCASGLSCTDQCLAAEQKFVCQ